MHFYVKMIFIFLALIFTAQEIVEFLKIVDYLVTMGLLELRYLKQTKSARQTFLNFDKDQFLIFWGNCIYGLKVR